MLNEEYHSNLLKYAGHGIPHWPTDYSTRLASKKY